MYRLVSVDFTHLLHTHLWPHLIEARTLSLPGLGHSGEHPTFAFRVLTHRDFQDHTGLVTGSGHLPAHPLLRP